MGGFSDYKFCFCGETLQRSLMNNGDIVSYNPLDREPYYLVKIICPNYTELANHVNNTYMITKEELEDSNLLVVIRARELQQAVSV